MSQLDQSTDTFATAHSSTNDGLPGPLIAITGPTASGKSALANRIADLLDSPIISADAMQLYRGMDIGTAKEHSPRLRMVDVADIGTAYSVALYQKYARASIDAALAAATIPIICGGTGLYLDAIIDTMVFPSGDTTSSSRRYWQSYAAQYGASALHSELMKRDPASAVLVHPHNVRRVIRALELADAGESYAITHQGLHQRIPYYHTYLFALTMQREHLYARINERVDAMFAAGLVDEVRQLERRGLREAVTARHAIGYKEVLDYLDGIRTLPEAIDLVKMRTRHYAKRQLSWIRRRSDVIWLDYDVLTQDEAVETILNTLNTHSTAFDCVPRAAIQEGGQLGVQVYPPCN